MPSSIAPPSPQSRSPGDSTRDKGTGATTAWLSTPPPWIRLLVALRNAGVQLVGLKPVTPLSSAPDLRPGGSLGPFHVYGRSEDEILLGDDDTHLRYRISVLIRDGTATLSTAVQYDNVLGRLYFVSVRPFHGWIARTMLRRGLVQNHRTSAGRH